MDRPFKSWPEWMLRSLVTLRKRRSMWTDAYFELVERGNDAARDFAESHGSAWVVESPRGMQ